MRVKFLTYALAILAGTAVLAAPARALTCNHSQSFGAWLQDFKREAVGMGISQRTVNSALQGVTYAPDIVRKDRAQGVFSQTFIKFSGRMVAAYRLKKGRSLIRKHRSIFARVEKKYGVPAPVIVGFWGLETDFGANNGKSPILRSLATLAYDCRRPEMFREQLIAALKIVERGDLRPSELVGAWAGEIGQTQFLPAHYYEFGVDFNRDGKVDLRHSVPDVLASTARLLVYHGWRRGEPWLQEVVVPRKMPWQEADISIQHPRSDWVKWGVKLRSGKQLPADNLPASLILPMGRNGPAFLGYNNFRVYTEWNQSLIYALTAAYYATRLDGAPAYNHGRGPLPAFSAGQVKELQRLLTKHGYDVGEIDGKLGVKSRAAVRKAQIKLGLPADS
ncbi:MAG: lytic murein transglycosylase [Alphaproteobacteria bacterium]